MVAGRTPRAQAICLGDRPAARSCRTLRRESSSSIMSVVTHEAYHSGGSARRDTQEGKHERRGAGAACRAGQPRQPGAAAVCQRDSRVVGLGWPRLGPAHLDEWRQGRVECLERVVQARLPKLATAQRVFHRWAQRRGLAPSETGLARRCRRRSLCTSRSQTAVQLTVQ